MKNEYAEKLHQIEMSDKSKSALIDMLTREIDAARLQSEAKTQPGQVTDKLLPSGTSKMSKQKSSLEKQRTKKRGERSFAPFKLAAAVAVIAVVGIGGTAYALDLDGIQRTVQIWIHGDQTDATFVVDNGTYSLDYQNADGNTVHQGGGGVVMNLDGTERPATEEELLDEVNALDVSYEEDGRVVAYYLDQQMDITDKFEDGVCYLQLQVDGKTMYVTVKYQDGYAMSPNGYVQPNMFN